MSVLHYFRSIPKNSYFVEWLKVTHGIITTNIAVYHYKRKLIKAGLIYYTDDGIGHFKILDGE